MDLHFVTCKSTFFQKNFLCEEPGVEKLVKFLEILSNPYFRRIEEFTLFFQRIGTFQEEILKHGRVSASQKKLKIP